MHRCGISTVPDEIKLKIISYLSFDEISGLRRVSKHFNGLCMGCLNHGFAQAENFHALVQKEIKKQLPRRESERRDHAFCRHADIVSAIETRMSLLQITYAKYIEAGYSCFIPGKVLDELMRVLRFVRVVKEPSRSHEVLMELRDISSMAMEHFEDKILPSLKKQLSRDGIAVLPGGLTVDLDQDQRSESGEDTSAARKRVNFSPIHGLASKRRRLSPGLISTRRPLLCGSSSLTLAGGLTTSSPETPQTDPLIERLAESERTVARQGELIEEQSRGLEDLKTKLADYNHRFCDLAEVLRSHYASTQVHDKLTSLIQSGRGANTRPSDAAPVNNRSKNSTASTSSYTSIIDRGQR